MACSLVAGDLPSIVGGQFPIFSYDHALHTTRADYFGFEFRYMSGNHNCYLGQLTVVPVIKNDMANYTRTCMFGTHQTTTTELHCSDAVLSLFPNTGQLTITFDHDGPVTNAPIPFTANFGHYPTPAQATATVTVTDTEKIITSIKPTSTTTVFVEIGTTFETATTIKTEVLKKTNSIHINSSSGDSHLMLDKRMVSIPSPYSTFVDWTLSPSNIYSVPSPCKTPELPSPTSYSPPHKESPSTSSQWPHPKPNSSSSYQQYASPSSSSSNEQDASPSSSSIHQDYTKPSPSSSYQPYHKPSQSSSYPQYHKPSLSPSYQPYSKPGLSSSGQQYSKPSTASSYQQYSKSSTASSYWQYPKPSPSSSYSPPPKPSSSSTSSSYPGSALSSRSSSNSSSSFTSYRSSGSSSLRSHLPSSSPSYMSIPLTISSPGFSSSSTSSRPRSSPANTPSFSSWPSMHTSSSSRSRSTHTSSSSSSGSTSFHTTWSSSSLPSSSTSSSSSSSSSTTSLSTSPASSSSSPTPSRTSSSLSSSTTSSSSSSLSSSTSNSSSISTSSSTSSSSSISTSSSTRSSSFNSVPVPYRPLATATVECPADNSTNYETACGAIYTIECSTDRYGDEIMNGGTTSENSLSFCIEDCDNTPGCVDASWSPGFPGTCYLKSTVGIATPNDMYHGARQISGCNKQPDFPPKLHRKRVVPAVTTTSTRTTAAPFAPDHIITQATPGQDVPVSTLPVSVVIVRVTTTTTVTVGAVFTKTMSYSVSTHIFSL